MQQNMQTLPHARSLFSECPHCPVSVDLSMTAFVDDVARRTLFTSVSEALRGVVINDKTSAAA